MPRSLADRRQKQVLLVRCDRDRIRTEFTRRNAFESHHGHHGSHFHEEEEGSRKIDTGAVRAYYRSSD